MQKKKCFYLFFPAFADQASPFPLTAQDKVTSMLIPAGFAVTGITLLVKGIDDLSWGKNRKEGF